MTHLLLINVWVKPACQFSLSASAVLSETCVVSVVTLGPVLLSFTPAFLSFVCSRHQQYECKWYIPLADLTFQTPDDSDPCPSIQVLPEHEIEEMKMKISVLKNEIQKEKVIVLLFRLPERLLNLSMSNYTLTISYFCLFSKAARLELTEGF